MKSITVILLFLSLFFVVTAFLFLTKAVSIAKKISLNGRYFLRNDHKKWIDRFLITLSIPVVLIESIVRIENGRWGNETLFLVHIMIVLFFILNILFMRFHWTGVQNQVIHKNLAKIFFFLFIATVATGSALISQLVLK